jgi:hypothetical protein
MSATGYLSATMRHSSENAFHHEVAEREIDGARNWPSRAEHRELVAGFQESEVRQRGADHPADAGDNGHRTEPPRMQRSAGRQRFDDFLRHHRQKERHADFVDDERRGV